MDFGIFMPPVADSWKMAQRAEALGFSRVWFYDTQMLNSELFAIMGATAMVTKKIRLGTGVMIPSNRIAPVAASGLATLNAMAPGRIDWGLSTGSTARSTMGLTRVKQADMEEYIRIVRALLNGETPEWIFEDKRRKIRFMDPVNVPAHNLKDPIPLHISAFGPKGRALIARQKAGFIDAPGSPEQSKRNVDEVKAAWTAEGNKAEDLFVTNTLSACILRPGENFDSPRVRQVIGPAAMLLMHKLGEEAKGTPPRPMPPEFQPLVAKYKEIYQSYQPEDARYLSNHRGHLMYLRPEEEAICNGDLIRRTTMTGPKEEIREKIREMKRNGVSHFAPSVTWRNPDVLEDWADLFEGV